MNTGTKGIRTIIGIMGTILAHQVMASPVSTGVIAAYTLVTSGSESPSGLIARAILPAGADCPTLKSTFQSGSRHIPMHERPLPANTSPAFNQLTVCESVIPKNAVRAAIGGHPIPARMTKRVKDIAVFGDVGCRVTDWEVQDCNTVQTWPLAKVAQSIAQEKPDVILFLGDFFYRESPCPAGQEAFCGSSPPPITGAPFTDSAYGWMADAIMPLSPIFSAAPIVVIRGNHEACDRGGNGFFLFFDPFLNSSQTCAPVMNGNTLVAPNPALTRSWSTDLKIRSGRTLRLAMVDSAYGNDSTVTPWSTVQRESYVQARNLTIPQRKIESWLLVHRPIFGHMTDQYAPSGDSLWVPWLSIDQQVASYGLLENYNSILSSHMHLMQAVQIPGQPGQMVLGNGATDLDPTTGYETPQYGPLANALGNPIVPGLIPYPAATTSFTAVEFGYAMVRPGRSFSEWSWEHYTPDGTVFAQCSQLAKNLSCKKASLSQ